jgi:hypothetical protein
MLRFVRHAFFAIVIGYISAQRASALITGGEGNDPVHDPGWPAGVAAVFNHPSRVAHWEGPPFGGGQSHAECRGNAQVLNTVLRDFAKVDTKSKKVVIHDGVGRSFWLNPNRQPEKADNAKIDWTFMVWVPANWERFGKVPGRVGRAPKEQKETDGPIDSPAQLDVYTGGNIKWADVVVPDGIDVVDERLEAHGFKTEDGTVIEGDLIDLADNKPVKGRVELQLIEPQKTGGYRYTVTRNTESNDKGKWVVKKAPAGWYQIVALADGYVPRVIGHARFDGQPGWQTYKGGLSKPTTVAGRVLDEVGKPMSDVTVRLMDVLSKESIYKSPDEYKIKTGADGRFRFESVPVAKSRVRVHKQGYCRPGLGEEITTPAENIELTMKPSAQVLVKIEFVTTRPEAYIVHITPEGGNIVGSWGGSGHIDEKNEITFSDVPPGRYTLVGRPNPGSDKEQSAEITVDLVGGETVEVPLIAQ